MQGDSLLRAIMKKCLYVWSSLCDVFDAMRVYDAAEHLLQEILLLNSIKLDDWNLPTAPEKVKKKVDKHMFRW